jgi:hypothetical protein
MLKQAGIQPPVNDIDLQGKTEKGPYGIYDGGPVSSK